MNAWWRAALSLAGATLIAFLLFAYFAVEADAAMDKSGVGDLAEFARLSRIAGVAFWSAAIFWLGSIISAQLVPQPFRGKALFWFGLVHPVLLVGVYAALIVGA